MYGLLAEKYQNLYKVLAHPTRIKIIRMLTKTKYDVSSIATKLELNQSNISQHLQILRKNRIVFSKSQGKRRVYVLSDSYKRLADYLEKFNS
ncbi:winged helix-turn-helix transcriptional regulator [Candidatus Nomurabacteria bacterium]|nr:winged helix-turn-helix transcriptional regulator [Candidatus Saccharibacteria bacterium]MCB9826686.1 winged helix-turn-helix transcriptional regulator [Candidatus Nomurabacteria bacterium]